MRRYIRRRGRNSVPKVPSGAVVSFRAVCQRPSALTCRSTDSPAIGAPLAPARLPLTATVCPKSTAVLPSSAETRVPKADTARVTARLLAERAVADLTVEDPPIEDVIELVFAQERPQEPTQ